MRVFKNLFGDGSKIHSDEIILGSENDSILLSDILDSSDILWEGFNNSESVILSKNSNNYLGLLVETNTNPPTSTRRGTVFVPTTQVAISYYPAMLGSVSTWIRIYVKETTFGIHSVGNENLYATRIIGVGRKRT